MMLSLTYQCHRIITWKNTTPSGNHTSSPKKKVVTIHTKNSKQRHRTYERSRLITWLQCLFCLIPRSGFQYASELIPINICTWKFTNQCADFLAKKGVAQEQDFRIYDDPLVDMSMLLYYNSIGMYLERLCLNSNLYFQLKLFFAKKKITNTEKGKEEKWGESCIFFCLVEGENKKSLK